MMKSISYWMLKAVVDACPNNAELGKVIRKLINNHGENIKAEE